MISVCLTNFNRTQLLFEAIEKILSDDRVTEIVISDDCSRDDVYQSMMVYYKEWPKVNIFRNEVNLDCYHNKARSLELATNDWCILFDSDNVIDKNYIDRLEGLIEGGLNDKTVYAPSFAKPHFNFADIAGLNIDRTNIAVHINSDKTQTMLNAMNYFVNRHEYLKVFDPNIRPVTSDSIYQNCRWLEAGNSIYVVPGLEYYHRVNDHRAEEGSHYAVNVRRTPSGLHENILNRLKNIR